MEFEQRILLKGSATDLCEDLHNPAPSCGHMWRYAFITRSSFKRVLGIYEIEPILVNKKYKI